MSKTSEKKIKSNKIKLFFPDYIAIVISLITAIAGIIVSLNRFWQYDVFFYDFGIFDMALWRVAHFKAPIIEHFVHRGQWIFADHLNPTIFLLSPLYWVTNSPEIILIAQAILFGISTFLIYLIGKHITKNAWYPIPILLCFGLFVGTQNAVITDFHETCLTVFFFLLTYLCFLKKRINLFWLFLILMLGTKESNYLLGVALGATFFIANKESRKIGIITAIVSVIYGLLAIKLIIPYFNGGSYQYSVALSANPLSYMSALIDNSIKTRTILMTFASFGFLPVLNPAFYILILEDFLSRFYPPFLTLSWGLGLHYSAVTAAIMALSSIYSLRTIERIVKRKQIMYLVLILVTLDAIFLYRFVLRGPFALAYNSAFYGHSKDFSFLDELVAKTPKDATIMTQNNLAPRFSHQQVILLEEKCKTCIDYPYVSIKPKYIVIDARSGQNPNDFYGVNDLPKLLTTIQKDKTYSVFFHSGDRYIFRRK